MTARTIGERWIESCLKSGKKTLMTDALVGTQLTAGRALTGSIILARRMEKTSPEQCIGAFLPTSVGAILMNMGAMLLGKTLVNLNYTAGRTAIESAIEQAGIKTVYTSTRFLSRLRERGIDTDWLEKSARLTMLEDCQASVGFFEKLITLMLVRLAPAVLLKKLFLRPQKPEQTAVILFSSGSEGAPKGVMLSHRNILADIDQVMDIITLRDNDVVMANLPIFHAFGLTATIFLPLLYKLPVVTHPDPTDVVAAASIIAEYKVTIIFATSSFFGLYVRNTKVSPRMLASLRLLVAGAEKLQTEVHDNFLEKFGKDILEGYGTTEAAPVVSVNLPTEADGIVRQKAGSVGQPIPRTRLKIIDPDTSEALPGGTAGMILVNGAQVMQGYLGQPEKTAEVFREIDGETWYVTGDKGYVDEEGFLFIQDRYSRFAKISGEMVSLSSLEAAICKAVGDSELEIVAVSLPHPKKGEMIVVLSNKALNTQTLKQQLMQDGYPRLALPAACHTVAEIPRLGSGKTNFAAARDLALQLNNFVDNDSHYA